nr:hypothetical protein GCM10025699_77750 [Microbacterium flavescens]
MATSCGTTTIRRLLVVPRAAPRRRSLAPARLRRHLYLHLDYREAHYAKVLLDVLFGRDNFLNEIIWAYDYGAKSRNRWPRLTRSSST